MADLRLCYVAHPLSGDIVNNLLRAERWISWILHTYPEAAIAANWITYARVLNDNNPSQRAQGIAGDTLMLRRCDELWLCGGQLSRGMAHEVDIAMQAGLIIRSFLSFGPSPPAPDVCVSTGTLRPRPVYPLLDSSPTGLSLWALPLRDRYGDPLHIVMPRGTDPRAVACGLFGAPWADERDYFEQTGKLASAEEYTKLHKVWQYAEG